MTLSANKVIILGCGPSAGVPRIGDPKGPYWGVCDPHNPKNTRLRASIYTEYRGVRFLVDTSPDLRQQLLTHNLCDFDAVFITHMHADHVFGVDDLRPLVFKRHQPFPLYASQQTLTTFQQTFPYLFQTAALPFYPQILVPHLVQSEIEIQGVTIQCFEQHHGDHGFSTGFRFGNMAYSPDFNGLDETALQALEGLDLWIVDCLGRTPKPTHNHLALTLEWIERVRPKRAVLTHMGSELDYETLLKELPEGVEPAYDGMILEF